MRVIRPKDNREPRITVDISNECFENGNVYTSVVDPSNSVIVLVNGGLIAVWDSAVYAFNDEDDFSEWIRDNRDCYVFEPTGLTATITLE